MSEFERKPDGGLNAWIETYEAMGGGENDAEMLCLLLELRRRRENQTEAERERDELRTLAEEQSRLAGINAARAQIAEAELARRDAAAGEPEFYVRYRSDGGYEGPLHKDATEECRKQSWSPLYTAAPPAASAPEGWKLMPLKASPEILQAGIKAHYERQKHQQPEDVEFKGPMECAYDDMLSAAPAPGGDGG